MCHLSDDPIDFCVVQFGAVGREFKRHDVHLRMLVASAKSVERCYGKSLRPFPHHRESLGAGVKIQPPQSPQKFDLATLRILSQGLGEFFVFDILPGLKAGDSY